MYCKYFSFINSIIISWSAALSLSEIAHKEVQLLIQVCLEVKTFDVALLHAVFLLRLQVHLVVILHTRVRATGHHRGQVLEDDARFQVLDISALIRSTRVHLFPLELLSF